jgi:hypothetical protein
MESTPNQAFKSTPNQAFKSTPNQAFKNSDESWKQCLGLWRRRLHLLLHALAKDNFGYFELFFLLLLQFISGKHH